MPYDTCGGRDNYRRSETSRKQSDAKAGHLRTDKALLAFQNPEVNVQGPTQGKILLEWILAWMDKTDAWSSDDQPANPLSLQHLQQVLLPFPSTVQLL